MNENHFICTVYFYVYMVSIVSYNIFYGFYVYNTALKYCKRQTLCNIQEDFQIILFGSKLLFYMRYCNCFYFWPIRIYYIQIGNH